MLIYIIVLFIFYSSNTTFITYFVYLYLFLFFMQYFHCVVVGNKTGNAFFTLNIFTRFWMWINYYYLSCCGQQFVLPQCSYLWRIVNTYWRYVWAFIYSSKPAKKKVTTLRRIRSANPCLRNHAIATALNHLRMYISFKIQ